MLSLYAVSLAVLLFLAYRRSRLWVITANLVVLGVLACWPLGYGSVLLGYALPIAPFLLVLNTGFLRRRLVSSPMRSWFRRLLPAMSNTEREALEAGTVWWDGDLFSGKPDFSRLMRVPPASLSAEEQAFLDGPAEILCGMLDDWSINSADNDMPEAVWAYIREQGFLSMIIPKAFGGLEFSAQGNSAVVLKLASRSQTAAVTVMVPNSLGPGELLLHFGTDEQKRHYLPRLARGEDIPCFALTGPYSGSDAASMPDQGVVCRARHHGVETLGIRVSWDKRYITLAPVATVLGLAFRVTDPDGLLGDREDLGITCALIPAKTRGVTIGHRHQPAGSAFMNGPTQGNDVFVPMDWVIGGQARVGQGWRMLVYCLSAGRAISLPALGTAASKHALATTSAYARVRRQFKTPIARLEGVAEVLARMAARTYRMDATRRMTLVALDQGEKPSVLSAVLKYHLTEDYRLNIQDALDIHAGKAVIDGPGNYLARVYQSVPVAITVEGANILTRSLIIFGQGAIRCHPFLLNEMRAATDADTEVGLRDFDIALFGHAGFTVSNLVRAITLGVTGGHFSRVPLKGPMAKPIRRIKRFSAAFAVVSDLLLICVGGRFKFMERMSGRLADVLSHLYMASATVKQFVDDGKPTDDLPVVQLALADSLQVVQTQLRAVLDNFPVPLLGPVLKRLLFPVGTVAVMPSDPEVMEAAALITRDSETRRRLTAGIYLDVGPEDPAGSVEDAFLKGLAAAQAESALRNALGQELSPLNAENMVSKGLETGIITEEQAELVRQSQKALQRVVAVDAFAPKRRRRNVKKTG